MALTKVQPPHVCLRWTLVLTRLDGSCMHERTKPTGVTNVHCLHVWSLTLGRTLVSAHVKALEPQKALVAAHSICEQMGVRHSTIQVCILPPARLKKV